MLVLWQALRSPEAGILPGMLLSEQSMKFICSQVPKADGGPEEIKRHKKALEMKILSDRLILMSVLSVWVL